MKLMNSFFGGKKFELENPNTIQDILNTFPNLAIYQFALIPKSLYNKVPSSMISYFMIMSNSKRSIKEVRLLEREPACQEIPKERHMCYENIIKLQAIVDSSSSSSEIYQENS
ncbi:hypothetical protein EYC80_001883 [Monilinia laxa]|uniref:Uncharacterized protein n=1 Tax=Monilinia laxa TaxID=61186 RepID=A0A5N6K735_MONLA|nr:hypothetical protein EYC80_001883 [Monilinia laxa]